MVKSVFQVKYKPTNCVVKKKSLPKFVFSVLQLCCPTLSIFAPWLDGCNPDKHISVTLLRLLSHDCRIQIQIIIKRDSHTLPQCSVKNDVSFFLNRVKQRFREKKSSLAETLRQPETANTSADKTEL